MDPVEIIYEKNDRVAITTLNRPARLNAFNARMGLEVKEAMTHADNDDSVRAIVVTGAGREDAGNGGFSGGCRGVRRKAARRASRASAKS
jgi:enoyl-CoA hydratase/carnithine racemase